MITRARNVVIGLAIASALLWAGSPQTSDYPSPVADGLTSSWSSTR